MCMMGFCMSDNDPGEFRTPSSLRELQGAIEPLVARRAEFQERARAWVRTPQFREVYETSHPGWLVKVIGTLLGKGAHFRARSSSLWNDYQRLASDGELVLGASVIGNADLAETPLTWLPAAVLASSAQDARSVAESVLFARRLVDAYLLGEGDDIPASAELIADDAYRPFRRRPLPVSETGDVAQVLYDVKVRGIDAFGSPLAAIVPLLLGRDGRVSLAVPWHVLMGLPAPTETEITGADGVREDKSEPVPPPLPVRTAEVSPGGSTIHRHQPRQTPFEPAMSDGATAVLVEEHVGRHLGEVKSVFHELISDLVHLDVLFIPPTPERPYHSLVTSGMSDRPMTVPDGAEDFLHAELMLCLPADWKLGTDESGEDHFRDERNYWPIRWLKTLARLPHEYGTWLGAQHTIPNGNPARPLAPGVPFTGFILGPVFTAPEGFGRLDAAGKTIHFLSVIPLTTAEMDFKLAHGADALFSALVERGVTELVDVNRPSVV